MAMIKMIDDKGNNINVSVPSKELKKLSKNKRNKLKRYGIKLNIISATAKGSGIVQEYYNFFDSHKECRNPRTILIEQGF